MFHLNVSKPESMSLRINDIAPDFTAETAQGPIHFHEWIGDNWAVLFSHQKDFIPICTTELGAVAGLEAQFADRKAKVIRLSVDPVGSHSKWTQDILYVSGNKVKYPLIGDPELKSPSFMTCFREMPAIPAKEKLQRLTRPRGAVSDEEAKKPNSQAIQR
jgi:peroxiredoxin